MSGYTKLFNSILASTVWSEPNDVRIVWITMLAMANKDGIVEGSVPGLAVFARLPIDVTETALARLSSPDPHSRSKEQDGRRIETIDGGWKLINHFKYRQQMSADERREYLRIKQQEQRTKKKLKTSASTARQQSSRNVNTVSDEYTKSTHTAPAPDTAPDPEAAPVPVINNQPDRERSVPIKADKRASLSPAAHTTHETSHKVKSDPFLDDAVTERAGRFIDKYQELYPANRNGARYAVRPARDYAAAVTLCQTWPDDARLEKLAICFLTTDHKFAEEGSRTIPQFLALASWCDGKLAEWEKANGNRARH